MKPSLRGATHFAPASPAARVVARLARVTLVLALILAAALPSSAGDPRRGPRAVGTVFGWGSGFGSIAAQVGSLSGVVSVSAGYTHLLVLKSDGTVLAQGENSHGQLGVGTNTPSATPVLVNISNVVAVSASYSYSLALKSDGTVWAWGYNQGGPEYWTPTRIWSLSGVTAIAAGGYHSLALKSDGTVWGWGWNGAGALGDGTFTDRPTPVAAGIADVVAIDAGYVHTVALKSDGTVWAWGRGMDGLLGNGGTTDSSSPVQVVDPSDPSGLLTGVVAISARLGGHTLALKSDGTVRSWGVNGSGALGDGTFINRPTPVQVSGVSGAVSISAGDGHSLALMGDGTVRAWGSNSEGQLGNNSTTNSSTPVFVDGLSGIVAIAGGFQASLALQSQAIGTAWGDNTYGCLGNAGGSSSVPTAVDTLSGLTAISAGFLHSMGLRADGTVWTWGDDLYGEMGVGPGMTGSSTPIQIMVGGPAVKAVATGEHLSLALTSTGAVYAWGLNENGQTGVGTVDESGWVSDPPISHLPVQVSGIGAPVAAVAAGAYHSLALDSSGTVWAWGWNSFGQLGTPPDPYTSRSVPAQVPGLSGVVAVAGGAWHSLALKSDGTVWAWGRNNDGQLGDPQSAGSATPLQVVDPSDPSGHLTGVAAIAAGSNFSLALKADGTVRAWGNNGIGQLGNSTVGTTSLVPVPVQAPDATQYLTGVVAIDAGYEHTLALKSNGVLLAWGWNSFGQLGNGATTVQPSSTPVHVRGPQAPSVISAGYRHSLALALTHTPDPAIAGYITITADNQAITYGSAVPTLTYSLSPSGTLDQQANCTTTATPASPVGTYPITCSGAIKTDYLIDYVPGTLTVNPAVLTVIANDITVGAGSETPTLTASITGFVNGETPEAVIDGSPVLSLPVLNGVGTYVIGVSLGDLQAANYTFIFMPGRLRVTSDALQLFNNYFVTGDFVTGSVVLRGEGDNGKATGDITIPSIPATAEIVAAYLYWQTLEDGTTAPGFLQGTFRGYGVNGEKLGGDLPYSDATASGVMRFYRANVLGFLPLGTDGRRVATGAHPVVLPDSGSAGVLPVTPGATLVVIYRVMSKTEPLRAVVIYDGAFSASAGNLYQTVRGFYDADSSSPSKLAYLWSHAGSWEGTAEARSVAAGAEQIALNESLSTRYGPERRRLQHAGQERPERRAAERLEDQRWLFRRPRQLLGRSAGCQPGPERPVRADRLHVRASKRRRVQRALASAQSGRVDDGG